MTRLTLEMGGNDAAIVRPDVHVPSVAKKVFERAMMNSGQVCIAIKRVYVHDAIYDEFVKELKTLAEDAASHVGNGSHEGVRYGPLNNAKQFERVKCLVDEAVAKGGEVVAGGSRPVHLSGSRGYFYAPTIVVGVSDGDCRLVDEEQFGPALPVMRYSDDEEAIARANASPYGLGASVWTSDMVKGTNIALRLEAGSCWVNDHANNGDGELPFGGVKKSGLGREHGEVGDLDSFTETVVIRVSPPLTGEDPVHHAKLSESKPPFGLEPPA